MRRRQRIHFHGQGPYLVESAAIQTHPFVNDHITNHIPLQICVIFFCQFLICIGCFLTQAFDQFFFQCIEGIAALMLAASGL